MLQPEILQAAFGCAFEVVEIDQQVRVARLLERVAVDAGAFGGGKFGQHMAVGELHAVIAGPRLLAGVVRAIALDAVLVALGLGAS